MGSLCSNPQEATPRESEPAPAASRPAPAPKTQVARETSTVYREKLINLHDKARRAAHEDKPQSIPEHKEDAAAPKEQYQRFANVFAAPLKLVEDFVAPVFAKSHEEKEFLEKVVSLFIVGGWIYLYCTIMQRMSHDISGGAHSSIMHPVVSIFLHTHTHTLSL